VTTGDLRWAARGAGRLSRGEELTYLLSAARAVVLARFDRLGRRAPAASRDLAPAQRPPDTAFARVAYEASRAADDGVVLAHCLRTWLWADLLARAEGLDHDPELLYASCVLHDLGLTPAHWLLRADCFAVEGALAARDLADRHGYGRGEALAEAISLHVNVSVAVGLGAEAHLLNAGAAADLLGSRVHEVGRPARVSIEQRYPRGDLATGLVEPLLRQAAARPRSRIGVLERRVGFGHRVLAHQETVTRSEVSGP
jgi:hypothetical protein